MRSTESAALLARVVTAATRVEMDAALTGLTELPPTLADHMARGTRCLSPALMTLVRPHRRAIKTLESNKTLSSDDRDLLYESLLHEPNSFAIYATALGPAIRTGRLGPGTRGWERLFEILMTDNADGRALAGAQMALYLLHSARHIPPRQAVTMFSRALEMEAWNNLGDAARHLPPDDYAAHVPRALATVPADCALDLLNEATPEQRAVLKPSDLLPCLDSPLPALRSRALTLTAEPTPRARRQ